MFKRNRSFIKFFQSKTVRTFTTRDNVFQYLEKEVFVKDSFSEHIRETATTLEISYLLAYEIITNFLTDILYEIDIAVSNRKKRKKISVLGYFFLEIGFMLSVQNKKMFIEQIIIKNKDYE